MPGWWQRWQQRREARALSRRAIPDALWALTLARHPFLAERRADDREALRRLATLFLDRKEFTGANGLQVTDEMAVAIAAQACLPVLHLGLQAYDDFVGIVVHPAEVVARRVVTDADGVVHHYDEVLAGEAMEGGPVMLSWADVSEAGDLAEMGYNVVIHEFVHKLDMANGEADGVPPLPDRTTAETWRGTLQAAYDAFCRDVDEGFDTFLDPYGAQSLEEFFPVAAEAFFVAPVAFRQHHPTLYTLFASYFRQDPATSTG
jgi:MtfA peptidase